jgi:antitoxin component of MazEF toxin-antitoxin module
MEFKTIISANGEMMLPKAILQALGIKAEAEVSLSVRDGEVLEIKPVKSEAAKEAANTSAPEMDITTLTIIETSML